MVTPGVPAGWPVFAPGLYMDHIGPVLVVYLDARATDAVFDRHLDELARAIDQRQWPVGVLYEVPTMRGLDARRRQKAARLFTERAPLLKKTTAAFALVTAQPLVRGLLNAVYWVAPPPYPHRVVATPREGFAFVADHMTGLRGEVLYDEYEALLARYRVRPFPSSR